MNPLLEVKNLHISFHTYAGIVNAVRGVNFSVKKGETFAIVGESGSGKSATAKALMKLLPPLQAKIKADGIFFRGKNLVNFSDKEMQRIRGSDISMIFQDPMTALNPTMTVGKQVSESVRKHQHLKMKEAYKRVYELFELVGISKPDVRFHQYPHQLSGGMRQRVMIAMALACNPKILIADEPTTALDVTIQAQILALLKDIQKKLGTAIILITHDLGVVANMAHTVAVMYAGKMVEIGSVEDLFYHAQHPYYWGLLQSVSNINHEGELLSIPGSPPDLMNMPKGDPFAQRNEFALQIDYEKEPPLFKISDTHYAATWLLHPKAPKITPPFMMKKAKQKKKEQTKRSSIPKEREEPFILIKNVHKHFKINRKESIKAVNGVSFAIMRGETFGLVGESGCGKSTLGRTIMRLYETTSGEIYYDGKQINRKLNKKAENELQRKMQMVFQDPYASLDPRKTAEAIISEGLDIHYLVKNQQERKERVQQLLEAVGLHKADAHRYPHEFSGGQRQRIGIARALAVDPECIIADEPISALDVSIQAQVVQLLKKLQKEKGLTLLFIAHDLAMVKHISDRIGVMYLGRLVELAPANELHSEPLHPYTKALLSAIPIPNPQVERKRERIILEGDLPNPTQPPIGCSFRTRCPVAMDICQQSPIWQEAKPNHWVACHLINN